MQVHHQFSPAYIRDPKFCKSRDPRFHASCRYELRMQKQIFANNITHINLPCNPGTSRSSGANKFNLETIRLSKWDSIQLMHAHSSYTHDRGLCVLRPMYTCIWIFREVIPESVECTVYDASAAAYRIGPIIKMHSLTLVCESSDIRKCDPADPTDSKLVLLYEELKCSTKNPWRSCYLHVVSTLLTDRSSIAQSRHI